MTSIISESNSQHGQSGQVYKINAGKCEHCGNYKTWEFRVKNPKTGKLMPGHVNAEGFKLGDGHCPFWSSIMKRNAKIKNGKKDVYSQTITKHDKVNSPKVSNISSNVGDLSVEPDGQDLTISIESITINLTRQKAILLTQLLFQELCK